MSAKAEYKTLRNIFHSSLDIGIQFDFFRRNNQSLFQFFKGYDVNTWKVDFASRENQLVLIIIFHKDKTKNKANFLRFQESCIFEDFVSVNFYGQNAFFINVDNEVDAIDEIINLLLLEIFHLELRDVLLTLNVY